MGKIGKPRNMFKCRSIELEILWASIPGAERGEGKDLTETAGMNKKFGILA